MTRDFRERGLIVDEDVSHYDGTTAVVRTAHVDADEIEYLRWRAERWIKMQHFPTAIAHSPAFVARHGVEMLAHTFAGSSWRSALGLEDDHAVFARYRAQRRGERARVLDGFDQPASSFSSIGSGVRIAPDAKLEPF